MRALAGSAMGGADFEYLKTADIREKYMEEEGGDEQEGKDGGGPKEKKKKREPLGNDLDLIEMEPGFQI